MIRTLHRFDKRDGRLIESIEVDFMDGYPLDYWKLPDDQTAEGLPPHDPDTEIPVFDNGQWVVTKLAFFERPSPLHKWDGEKWVISLEDAKSMKLDELANARWEEEVGGLVLPNGMEVKTDRESQALMTGASLKALQDPEYTCNWKGANGWVVLDAMTIMYIGEAVRAHVQACFDKEMALSEAVVRATTDDQIQAITW
jgi:hypothetical protein